VKVIHIPLARQIVGEVLADFTGDDGHHPAIGLFHQPDFKPCVAGYVKFAPTHDGSHVQFAAFVHCSGIGFRI